ncbi:MAG: AAA family ATPase [Clostridia bacterium]|nr:AAA family ATPase [Clostridia bacterium]
MKKAYIIGIAGGSASGKSTFAKKLTEELDGYNVRLFTMDKYFKPVCDLPLITTDNKKEYRDYNCPDSFNLDTLKSDLQSAKIKYDIIVVEGLLTLWDNDIRALCDKTIFMDCPADIRIVRRIKRNLTWGLTLDEITDVYVDLVRYRHEEYVEPTKAKADMVLDSSKDTDGYVKAVINNFLQEQ